MIDRAGRSVGVLSRTDILVHDREKVEYLKPAPDYYDEADLTLPSREALPAGYQVENVDTVLGNSKRSGNGTDRVDLMAPTKQTPIRLLIVDDDVPLRQTPAGRFQRQGMTVTAVGSGKPL